MNKEVRAELRAVFKLTVIEYDKICKNTAQVCREWRYAETVPGHHVQVDVKFLFFKTLNGCRVRRFQYTAIDDATRIRAFHEFQAQFHWHVEDKGMRHVYIKPRSPQLNGKVERSHRSDKDEFYQLLTYTDDVDLNKKLAEWERFYNFDRPQGAFNGKTPYEALRSLLQ